MKLNYEPPNLYWYNGSHMGEVLQDVDGFYKWLPLHKGGYLDEGVLFAVARLLNELNKPWENEINEYFDASNS
jgi:hypothetical protein